MDINKVNELSEFAKQQVSLADKYAKVRQEAGQCECALEIMVADNLKKFREDKPNVGYEMAILMLLEINEDARKIFKQWKELTALYKGIEKQIEARQSLIGYNQSVMKYIKEGEKYG